MQSYVPGNPASRGVPGGFLGGALGCTERHALAGPAPGSFPSLATASRFGHTRLPPCVARGRSLDAEATFIALARSLTGDSESTTDVRPTVPDGQELAYLVLDRALGVDLLRGQHAQSFTAVSLWSLGSGMGRRDDFVDHSGPGCRSSRDRQQPRPGPRRSWTFVCHNANGCRIVHGYGSTRPSLSTRRFGSALASHGRAPLQWFPQGSYVPADSASRGVTVPEPADEAPQTRDLQARREAESASDRWLTPGVASVGAASFLRDAVTR
jgi:hypothetical protein